MTVLSVVQDVCEVVGVAKPTSLFSGIADNRTMQEMLALANEMAQRIAYDTRDWTALKKLCTYTGDGVKTAFDLPVDYKRMLLTANVRSSTTPRWPMTFIPDFDKWTERRLLNFTTTAFAGEWTIVGGQMLIAPAPGVGVTVVWPYLDRNCVKLASGGFGDSFVADGDSFRLDHERILKLGMIWQWKAQKGSPYAEDMGTYGDALTNAMGKDSPAPIIVGHLPISAAARVAYPWPVPT
jgi:hypothetical protein